MGGYKDRVEVVLPYGVDALAYPGGVVLAMAEGDLLDDGTVEEVDCHHTWVHRDRRVHHSEVVVVVVAEDRNSLVEGHGAMVVVVVHTQNRNVVVEEDKVHSTHWLPDWEVDRLVNTVVAQNPNTGLRSQEQYFHIQAEAVGDRHKSMLLRGMLLVLWVDTVVLHHDRTKNHHGYQNFLFLPRLESPLEREGRIRYRNA